LSAHRSLGVSCADPGPLGPELEATNAMDLAAERKEAPGAARQACLGILVLDTTFPRIPGDAGNAETWPFPARLRVVPQASVRRVVAERAEGLLEAFVEGAQALVAEGADGIATTCGFLSLIQAPLAQRLEVPVAVSSLMQVPLVQTLLPPGRRVGIVTFSAESLTPDHLAAAGAPGDTPIAGMPEDGVFFDVIMNGRRRFELKAMEGEVVAAGERLVERHPEVGAVVVECANMPPYSAALRSALGLPVYDFYSFLAWFHAGLGPRTFPSPAGGVARSAALAADS